MVWQPVSHLPTTTELPCSDDIPVDNEEQNLLPNLLLLTLASLWADRLDWYFGVDMAIYHTTGGNPRVPVVPDAFLSLGVPRRKPSREGQGRLSYAVWEEDGIVPILTLEMVSQTPGGEYDEKLEIYRRLGVLYYVLYNPLHWQRDRHQPFEVYKLVEGAYQLQIGEPYWMPEVELGIGRARQLVGGIELEVLLWHDEQGQLYPVPEEELRRLRAQTQQLQQQVEAERQRAEVERQRAARLAEYLRSLGLDPDNLPNQQ
ncbi:MAG: Uma2 family endonuclease [Synechococcales bacterium]|nr:Uma2 family endonuclease [Synechococcales bacterium]